MNNDDYDRHNEQTPLTHNHCVIHEACDNHSNHSGVSYFITLRPITAISKVSERY